MEKYPPWERIASPTDLRKKYESARSEIINYMNSKDIFQFIKLSFIFIIIDSFYLYLMKDNFNILIRGIQNKDLSLKIFPTLLCYLLLVSSIYYFFIIKNGKLIDAFLLGIFIYGVFETTNLAIFNNWSYKIALIDTLWGGILFLITTYLYKLF